MGKDFEKAAISAARPHNPNGRARLYRSTAHTRSWHDFAPTSRGTRQHLPHTVPSKRSNKPNKRRRSAIDGKSACNTARHDPLMPRCGVFICPFSAFACIFRRFSLIFLCISSFYNCFCAIYSPKACRFTAATPIFSAKKGTACHKMQRSMTSPPTPKGKCAQAGRHRKAPKQEGACHKHGISLHYFPFFTIYYDIFCISPVL